jgi:hypothetical protein
VRSAFLHSISGMLLGSALLVVTTSAPAFAQTQVGGTITGPTGANLQGTVVTATDAGNRVFRGTVGADGKFSIPLDPGTYTITVNSPGLGQQVFQNVAVTEGQTVTQDVTLAAATPFCIVKAAAPIPLTEGIDSAAFASAPEIRINTGANIVEGFDQVANFRAATAGGRVKMMYSDQGLHIAADLGSPSRTRTSAPTPSCGKGTRSRSSSRTIRMRRTAPRSIRCTTSDWSWASASNRAGASATRSISRRQ